MSRASWNVSPPHIFNYCKESRFRENYAARVRLCCNQEGAVSLATYVDGGIESPTLHLFGSKRAIDVVVFSRP
jgi:hypothetical protein